LLRKAGWNQELFAEPALPASRLAAYGRPGNARFEHTPARRPATVILAQRIIFAHLLFLFTGIGHPFLGNILFGAERLSGRHGSWC